jgi:large subunit ribosomal protein L29
MKLEEIRALSDQELKTKIDEARKELMNFRFQMAMGNLPDYTRLKQTRRLIARFLTVQRERQLAVKEGAK